MPLTPFHLGPGLMIGLLFLNFIDFPTFLIASVIVDIEPFIILFFNLDYPLHGFFHSFLGGTIVALLLAVVMSKIRRYLSPLMSIFKLEQDVSVKKILVASLSGIYIHILFDSPIYTDIQPFFPLNFNPFYRSTIFPGLLEMLICVYCFIGALIIYLFRLYQYKVKNQEKIQVKKELENLIQFVKKQKLISMIITYFIIGIIYVLTGFFHDLIMGKLIIFPLMISIPLVAPFWPLMVYADIINIGIMLQDVITLISFIFFTLFFLYCFRMVKPVNIITKEKVSL